MKYKISIMFIGLILLIVPLVHAVPAPDNEYYFNPDTEECINHWRGDESNLYHVPEGFVFSGLDDINCNNYKLKLGTVDPALVFCVDVGYETESCGEDGKFCVSSEGIKCNIWEYHCKCDNKSCYPNMNHTKVELCELHCPKIGCRGEGEFALVSECCGELKKILPIKKFDTECNNIYGIKWVYVCSDCGNNICEEWEDKCNCPEDCEEKKKEIKKEPTNKTTIQKETKQMFLISKIINFLKSLFGFK